MTEKNYTRHALKGFLIIFLGTVFVSFIDYFTKFFLARKLTVEEFGLFYAVLAFVTFFNIFRKLGFSQALAKIIPEYIAEKKFQKLKNTIFQVVSIQTVISLFMYGIVILCSNLVAKYYFKTSDAAIVLVLLAIAFLIRTYQLPLTNIYIGFQKFNVVTYMRALRSIFLLLAILILIKYGVVAPALAYLIAPLLLGIFHYHWYKKYVAKTLRRFHINIFDKRSAKYLFAYSVPSLMASIGTAVMQNIDVLLLTYFIGLKSVAEYNIIAPLALMLGYASSALIEVMVPVISELNAKRDKVKISAGINYVFSFLMSMTIPLIIVMALKADYILDVLFARKYQGISIELIILLIALLFKIIFDLSCSILVALGRPKVTTKLTLSMLLLNVILNSIFIPQYGLLAAVGTTMVCFAIFGIISFGLLNRLLPLYKTSLNLLKLILPAAMFYTIFSFADNQIFSIILYGGISSVIYLGMIFVLKILRIKDIKTIINRFINK